MKWKYHPKNNIYEWHKWYAWHPIVVDNKWVWLEYVMRRKWSNPLNYVDCGWNYKGGV